MRYFITILMIVLMAVNAKISYDLYYKERQYTRQLHERLEQQNLRLLALNDQFIALQHHQNTANPSPTHAINSPTNNANTNKTNNPTSNPQNNPNAQNHNTNIAEHHWIQDRLVFIDSLIKEHKISVALAQMIALKQDLALHHYVPDSLNLALTQALNQDQNQFAKYMQDFTAQQQAIHQLLKQLDQQFQQTNSESLDQKSNNWQWQTWFKLSRAEQIPNMGERHLHLKYLQLSLLLAQNSLMAGQQQFYQQQMQDLAQNLKHYPDSFSQDLFAQIQQILQQPQLELPSLTALHLMQNQQPTAITPTAQP